MSLGKKLFLSLAFILSSLSAEVEQVTLIWQPGLCGSGCVKGLYRELGKIRGIDTIDINEGTGRAYLTWKPDVKFSFQPINVAVRIVGIRVNDIRLKVRGKIHGSAQNLELISEGDKTPFRLLNPIIPQGNRAPELKSTLNRQISPEVAQELLETAKNNQTVLIEGQFFQPYRSPPNNLVIERVTVFK
ncbi:MAG: hypothetical protein KDK62_07310 [Chlamydiia bacterium]|nr:hypothetical protein [Chlamydiia bacterium]